MSKHSKAATAGVAIGYLRRSKESDERTVSLEVQQTAVRGYAEAKGWTVAEIVADDGVSGGKRSRFAGIAEAIERHNAAVVIVYTLDRFARDLSGMLTEVQGYARRGVELHATDSGCVEVRSSTGFASAAIGGLVAEMFRLQTAEKIRGAFARKRAKDEHLGNALPYGYRRNGKALVEDAAEQAMVARMIELRDTGLSLRAVSAKLAAEGFVSRIGKPFGPQLVKQVVHAQMRMDKATKRAAA